jgi:hypothetical protein
MSQNSKGDGLDLELSVTEEAVLKQLVRLENRMNKAAVKMEKNWNKHSRQSMRQVERMNRGIEASFDRSMARVGASMKTYIGGAVGAVLAGGIGEIATRARDVVRGIAEIGDQAKRSGVDAEAFQEWKYVAEQNRIGLDQMIDGLKELNLRADEFVVTGKGAAAEAFERLGYTGAALSAALKDPSELLLDIIGRLENMDDAAQIRIADEVFGGSAGERFVELIAQGEQGLRQAVLRAHEVGAIMDQEMIQKADELDRKFNDIGTSIKRVGKEAVVAVAEVIAAYGEGGKEITAAFSGIGGSMANQAGALTGDASVAEALSENGGAAAKAAKHVDVLAQTNDRLVDSAADLRNELLLVVEILDLVGDHQAADALDDVIDLLEAIAREAATGKGDAKGLRDRLREAGVAADGALKKIEDIDGISLDNAKKQVGGILGLLDRAASAAASIKKAALGGGKTVFGDMPSPPLPPLPAELQGLAPTVSLRPKAAPPMLGEGGPISVGGGAGRRSFADDLKDLQHEIAALEAEAAALQLVAVAGKDYARSIDFARKRAELLVAAQRAGKDITPELTEQVDRLAGAYVEAAHGAELASDRLERMQENAQRGADAMTDLFMGIMGGSDSAKSALSSLLLQIARLQAQRAFSSFASSSSGGGLMNWLGGLLSFEGGGDTGAGARAGGLDGKGGFLAMVHPNERIFDMKSPNLNMGGSAAGAGIAQAVGNSHMELFISLDGANGDQAVYQLAQEAVVQGIRQAMPGIHQRAVQGAVVAVERSMSKTKTFGNRMI